jgi:catechol 2,3-dioxygenase-like lactoylglutathione lyase family enzyme
MIEVTGLDHIVLKVADVERSLAWYMEEIGLPGERVEEWRAGEVFFPSVRIDARTIIDLFGGAPARGRGDQPPNLDHLCLVVAPTDLAAVAASGRFDVVEGPVRRWGAQGAGTSLYVRDPDGNVVELRYY